MADDRISELFSETGRDLQLSPPQLVHNTTAWGVIHQLDHALSEYQQDLFLNHLHFMPSLAPVTDPFVSAPTPHVADLLISAPTQQTEPCVMNMASNEFMMLIDNNKQLSPETKGISQPRFVASASMTRDQKRKGKEVHVECQNTKEAEYGKRESGSSSTKKLRQTLMEKNRRDRINEQFKNLQELIPPVDKVGQVSILDGAITQIKLLQRQVQMLSMMTPQDVNATEQYYNTLSIINAPLPRMHHPNSDIWWTNHQMSQ